MFVSVLKLSKKFVDRILDGDVLETRCESFKLNAVTNQMIAASKIKPNV